MAGLLLAGLLAGAVVVLRAPARREHLPRRVSSEVLGEFVRPHAREFGLDEDLVLRIIWVESNGDPEARSRDGALGLMQLMPRTAEDLARELGIQEYSLTDPDDNIRLGCCLLSRLLVAFNDDLHLALAAYHAGEKPVRRWHRNSPKGAMGRDILRNHGYPSTRKHVARVLKGYAPE